MSCFIATCRHEFINVWTSDNPISSIFIRLSRGENDYIPRWTLAAEHYQEGVVLWDIESKRSRPAVQVDSAGKNQFLYKTDSG